ncbi:MAG: phosphatase PAP2 family protein [Acidobacteriia bacterium]|nr:phosphatase PAP2 family protein [Terriglobia bacterium]
MKSRTAAIFLVLAVLAIPSRMAGQAPQAGAPADVQPAPKPERPISWKKLVPNILHDQKDIWLFPLHVGQDNHWIPVTAVLGTTAGLVMLDPHDAPYFRRTDSFHGFNTVFSGSNASYGILAVPATLYIAGLARKDSKMKRTSLLIGEAIADSEILTTVAKDVDRRLRPAAIPPDGNFSNTWFKSPGPLLRGRGSMPSGHTIAAFSIATVISRRYGNHRWVPIAAYGLAGLVGFSRVTLSAHFVSDVFMGAALGYSISRFPVLHQ